MELAVRFDKLTLQEPALKALEAEVHRLRRRRQDRLYQWYNLVKPKLVYLVGFGAAHPGLRTCEAYDVAYDYLLAVLEGRGEAPAR